MPWYKFEAMDRTGQEIKDEIEAPSEEEAQTTIRQMGYFVTKISLKKAAAAKKTGAKKKRSFTIGEPRAVTSPRLLVSCRFSKTPACRFFVA